MAYIRSKKIYGRKYFYLVECTRLRGRVVQRVLKYLGWRSPALVHKKKK